MPKPIRRMDVVSKQFVRRSRNLIFQRVKDAGYVKQRKEVGVSALRPLVASAIKAIGLDDSPMAIFLGCALCFPKDVQAEFDSFVPTGIERSRAKQLI